MTFEQLLDILESMTDEQLKFNVVIHHGDEWVQPSLISFVNTDTDEEGFKPGQPIII